MTGSRSPSPKRVRPGEQETVEAVDEHEMSDTDSVGSDADSEATASVGSDVVVDAPLNDGADSDNEGPAHPRVFAFDLAQLFGAGAQQQQPDPVATLAQAREQLPEVIQRANMLHAVVAPVTEVDLDSNSPLNGLSAEQKLEIAHQLVHQVIGQLQMLKMQLEGGNNPLMQLLGLFGRTQLRGSRSGSPAPQQHENGAEDEQVRHLGSPRSF